MIEFHHVHKQYASGVTAVDDLSFHLAQGTITCLLGPSGCGKTTTLKLINRLLEPSTGEIKINHPHIQAENPIALKRAIGYVVQGAGLLPHLPILQNIALVAEVSGTSRKNREERASALMHLVGLEPTTYAKRYPRQLSGGQQQRVGLARALMQDPPLLLMDEPFGGLDPLVKHRLIQEFATLNQTLKKTIVMVTHDLGEAFQLADKILLMNLGKLVQVGSREDFLNRPVNDFVSTFIQSQREYYI